MVRMPNDDIYSQTRVENKLDTMDVFVPMTVRGRVRGRPVAYAPARAMMHMR
jgi:hypothetical protein